MVVWRSSCPRGSTRAVCRHGADAALAADLHARLGDSANVPQDWRSRLHELVDRAIAFARDVAGRLDNEAEARRATIPYGQEIELHGFDFLRAPLSDLVSS